MFATTFGLTLRAAAASINISSVMEDIPPITSSIHVGGELVHLACGWDSVCFVKRSQRRQITIASVHTGIQRTHAFKDTIVSVGATANDVIAATQDSCFCIGARRHHDKTEEDVKSDEDTDRDDDDNASYQPPQVILKHDEHVEELPLPLMTTVRHVACGKAHFLVLSTDGELFASGNNNYGQLGNGSAEPETALQRVEALRNQQVSAIACGGWHNLVLCADGTVLSFGWNSKGQLGRLAERQNGFDALLHLPSQLPGPVRFERSRQQHQRSSATSSAEPEENSKATSIVCGASHSVVLIGGELHAFGWGES